MTETLDMELPRNLQTPTITSLHGLKAGLGDHTIGTNEEDPILNWARDSTVMYFAVEPKLKYYSEKLKSLARERSRILTRLRVFPWFSLHARERLEAIESNINAHQFLMADLRGSDPVARLTTAKQIMDKCESLIAEIEEKLR